MTLELLLQTAISLEYLLSHIEPPLVSKLSDPTWEIRLGCLFWQIRQQKQDPKSLQPPWIEFHSISYLNHFSSPPDETSFEAGIKVQIHTQDEPPFIDQLGFGVAPGFQTFVSCQEQRVSDCCCPISRINFCRYAGWWSSLHFYTFIVLVCFKSSPSNDF